MISMISNVMNIGGNAILIWVFHLGVAGAQSPHWFPVFFCAVVVLYQLRKDRQPIVVRNYLKIRPDWSMIGRILGLGIPSGIENSMFQLGKLAIQSTVSTLGTTAIAAQAMTNILENLNGIAAIGVGVGLMTIVGQCLGAGRKDEAVYYIKKTLRYRRMRNYRKLPDRLRSGQTGHHPGWHGKNECSHVHPHDQLDYHCETPRVDNGICPGIWTPGGRRCEVFHDHILLYHVGLQILSLRISHPCPGIWPHGCLDRNVCGLDGTRNHIYMEIPQPQVVGA